MTTVSEMESDECGKFSSSYFTSKQQAIFSVVLDKHSTLSSVFASAHCHSSNTMGGKHSERHLENGQKKILSVDTAFQLKILLLIAPGVRMSK
jgi:hypothetical protein